MSERIVILTCKSYKTSKSGARCHQVDVIYFVVLKMREYDELYDWLAQSKLLAYMDNFAESGFDLTAMVGLTAEVRVRQRYVVVFLK